MPELMQVIFNLPEKSFAVRLLKWFEKLSVGFADLVLTVNVACKQIYSSRGCPPGKISVVINSPEDDIFQYRPASLNCSNSSESARRFVILYHGSLLPRNGFDLAVSALETARKTIPGIKLIVCGERTSFFDNVMESVRKRGLQESVEYLGARNRQQIVEAISDCDVGIIPNHPNIFTEINTPTRIFECLALGKPVIAPRTQGIRDYFDADGLIYFEAGNAYDLARKIEFAYCHPEEVADTVKRGQEVYLSHTWSRERLSLLNSISELL
jgi:glycosyltransferase involved in cell wall biosynthesis